MSHVLVVVDDLPGAVAEFRDAGFDVDLASTRHAHVWFARGPIVELLTHPARPARYRFLIDLLCGRGAAARMLGWHAVGEGYCDVALLVGAAELGAVRRRLATAGEAVGRTVAWRRRTPAGDRVRFRFAYPRRVGLPFLVTPYEPAQHPATTAHANGATGVATVVLGVAEADRPALTALLGPTGPPHLRLVPAARTGVLEVELAGLDAPVLARSARFTPTVVTTGEATP